MILNNCTVTHDTAGGKYYGGGLYNVGGTIYLNNCTFSHDTAGGYGGGVYNTFQPAFNSPVVGVANLTNCTFSDDSAQNNYYGGGFYNSQAAVANLVSCTFSGNMASYGGGIYNYGVSGTSTKGSLTLANTIVAGNKAPSGGTDIYNKGNLTSLGGNLIGNNSDNSGWISSDILNKDPLLAPLGSYGGLTQTMPLRQGSPAIQKANADFLSADYDQRGFALDSPPDIGAFQAPNGWNGPSVPLIVNTASDSSNDSPSSPPGELSLRQAVNAFDVIYRAMNITFDPAVFGKSRQTIVLTAGQLDLTSDPGVRTLVITGPTAGLTVSGGGQSRVFEVDAGVTAIISGLTITRGNSGSGNGGGIANYGTTTLNDCTISGNNTATTAGHYGGGIFTKGGALYLTNCTIASNAASQSGGGIEAQGAVTVTSSTFSLNKATAGGAIDNLVGANTVKVQDSILAGDSAAFGPEFSNKVTSLGNNLVSKIDGSTGWISSDLTGTVAQPLDARLAPLGNYGGPAQTLALLPAAGALPASPAIGKGASVSGVTTDQRGMPRGSLVDIGAFQTSLLVESPAGPVNTAPAGLTLAGAVSLGNAYLGPIAITFDPKIFASGQTITLTDGQLELQNTGTIPNWTITGPAAGVTVSGNSKNRVLQVDTGVTASISVLTITGGGGTADRGGGILNLENTNLTLTKCTISGNTGSTNGGGLANYGTAILANCTVSGNHSATSAGHNGGGIFTKGGALYLTNCTIASNTASQSGGGIEAQGAVTVTGSTFSLNKATAGGAIDNNVVGAYTVKVQDSILAGDSAAFGPEFSNKVTSLGNNLVSKIDGSTGWISSDLTGTVAQPLDARLAPLANYGGPTQTLALLPATGAAPASPAIGKGASVSGVTTDQRGMPRGSLVDIGSFQTSLLVESPAGPVDTAPAQLTLAGAVSLGDAYLGPIAITFDPEVFTGGQTITLTAGQLELQKTGTISNWIITGPAGGLSVSGGGQSRVLLIDKGVTASISGLTITGGNSGSGNGGGIANYGTTTVNDCTISGNQTGTSGGHYGGGIFTKGTHNTKDGALYLTNCTIASNKVTGGGGGIEAEGDVTVTSCTFSLNDATVGGGAIDNSAGKFTVKVQDSILAGDSAPQNPEFYSFVTSLGNNMVSKADPASGWKPTDLTGTDTKPLDARLAPLGNYGGPTPTMALLSGSPAIGKGVSVSSVMTDQRGMPRGSLVDIGAFQTSLVVESTAGPVNTTTAQLTLAGAVSLGNAFAGPIAITFDPKLFTGGQTITLTAGQLELQNTGTIPNWTITGPAAGLTVNADSKTRVFQVDPGVTAAISGLTITGGGGTADRGGGILNRENTILTLTICTITGNAGSTNGAGLANYGKAILTNCTVSGNTAGKSGGGLFNNGSEMLTDSTVSGNTAGTGGGAGLYNNGTLTLTSCTVSDNSGGTLGGAGLLNTGGIATLTDTIVARNTDAAKQVQNDIQGGQPVSNTSTYNLIGPGGSGGLTNGAGHNIVLTDPKLTGLGLAPLEFYGGPTETMALVPESMAIGAGTMVGGVTTDQRGFALHSPVDIGAFQSQSTALVVNTTVDGSSVPLGKLDLRGAVDLACALPRSNTVSFDTTVFAAPQTITLEAGQLELFNLGGSPTIMGAAKGVTVSGGGQSRVFQVDAGVSATISGLTISGGGGTADRGGGLLNSGTVTLLNCTVSGNTASTNGGGLANYGMASLINSTVSGNRTATGGTHYGGGIFTKGGAINISNCTIASNIASSSGGGLEAQGLVTITISTFSLNRASGSGGAIDNYYGGFTVNVQDSILAGDSAPSGPEVSGPVKSLGNNLVSKTDGSSGWIGSDLTGTIAKPLDARLAPLANYGGPTQTLALLPATGAAPASPAIGTGAPVSGVTTDQRGLARGSLVDIGAFQTSLLVESTAGPVNTAPAQLTLAGAVSLGDAYLGPIAITFDPKVFTGGQTTSL